MLAPFFVPFFGVVVSDFLGLPLDAFELAGAFFGFFSLTGFARGTFGAAFLGSRYELDLSILTIMPFADAFLGFTVPIYYGCPNVYDYFPKESLIQIDIFDTEGSIAKIKEIIATEGEYERRLDAVKEARRRVIEEYNLLAMINKIVQNTREERSPVTEYKIYNRRIMRVRHLPDLARFLGWRIKNFIKSF